MVNNRKILLAKINSSLVFMFLLLLPTQFGKHFFFSFSFLSGVRVDYLAPTIYLIDIVSCLLFLVNWKIIFNFVKKKRFFLVILLIGINLIISKNKPISLYQDLKLLEFLFIFLIFKKSRLSGKFILWPLTIAALLELGLSIYQLASGHSIQGLAYFFGERYLNLTMPAVAKASLAGIEFLRPYGTFSHANSLAGFYLLLYFFILTNKKFGQQPLLKKIFLLIACFLVLLSFSKIAILSLFFLTAYYWVRTTDNRSCRVCLLAKVVSLLVVSIIFLRAQADPSSLQKRLILFKNALKIIANNFVFGVGHGNYLIAQNHLPQNYLDIINQPVHNIFLLFISEWGVLGTGLVIYLTWSFIRFLLKKNFLIFLIILLTGFFDHYWLSLNQNFLLLAVVLGGL